MKGRDFGLGLLVLAIVAATVTAVVVSGRDTSAPARAEDTTHELSTPVSPEGCGEVTAKDPGETTVPSPASQWTLPHNAYVQVTARAHEGCTFSKWAFDFAGYPVEQTTNPTQFQLIEDMTATAHFTGTPASPTPTPTATVVPPPVTASCKWSTLGEDPVLNPGLKSDRETLLKATSTLAGTATLNWSVDTPMADWDGVGLDGTPRRVTSLVLKAKELTGSIPTSFGSLAMLDTLALGQNQLTGAIPVELGNLASLTQLHLEQNQLTGSIPAELGNLTLLTHLVLDDNQLAGAVREELWSLTGLTSLYLAGNMLVGCVPEEWHDVANNDLDQLGLEACSPQRVCGTGTPVPDPAANPRLVEDCEALLAWRDTLAGTATLNWSAGKPMTSWTGVTIAGTPQRVTRLELPNGGLTGQLSGLFGQLEGLTELRLNGNTLTGRIPSKVAMLSRLTHVYLAGNAFTGCMPPSLPAVANHDLATLGLPDCGAPVDVSYGNPTLTAGTYQVTWAAAAGDSPPLVFDIPEGLRLELDGWVLQGPGEVGLILWEANSESYIALDVYEGGEWNRGMTEFDARLWALYDRVVESAWVDRGSQGK